MDPADVRFTGIAVTSPDRGRLLVRTVDHLKYDVLAVDEVASAPLIVAEGLQQLVTAMLLTFLNTALDVLRWGFSMPGRFAVEYRNAYGRSPAETLRR